MFVASHVTRVGRTRRVVAAQNHVVFTHRTLVKNCGVHKCPRVPLYPLNDASCNNAQWSLELHSLAFSACVHNSRAGSVMQFHAQMQCEFILKWSLLYDVHSKFFVAMRDYHGWLLWKICCIDFSTKIPSKERGYLLPLAIATPPSMQFARSLCIPLVR